MTASIDAYFASDVKKELKNRLQILSSFISWNLSVIKYGKLNIVY